jgi:hypothetical protein
MKGSFTRANHFSAFNFILKQVLFKWEMQNLKFIKAGGPKDTQFLFDKFISMVKKKHFYHPLAMPSPLGNILESTASLPIPSKVLILGSGALSIGQVIYIWQEK